MAALELPKPVVNEYGVGFICFFGLPRRVAVDGG